MFYRAAVMLQAQQGIDSVLHSSFHALKKETRDKLMRNLKTASSQFMEREVKDYREVIKNLALSIMGRRGNG